MLRRRLYLQIYLTVIACLLLVVILSAAAWEITGRDRPNREVLDIVGKLVNLSLPPASAPQEAQHDAVFRLGRELNLDVSLFDQKGGVIAVYGDPLPPPRRDLKKHGWHRTRGPGGWVLGLPDGRWLAADPTRHGGRRPLLELAMLLGSVAVGVGLGAYPFVRRITRRLEALQHGVETIGGGDFSTRVDVAGRDEIASLAASFNEAAAKIETLIEAHRLLLANASHELRTPLSRIRLGVEMLERDKTPERRAALEQDIAELDALIDEILLMSRLDTGMQVEMVGGVDLTALVAEEGAHYPDCTISGTVPMMTGDPRLLRRMIRNLLENADRHGAPPVEVSLAASGDVISLTVSDHGPGIASAEREKVLKPFYRVSDRQNVKGFGLGLSLVAQIAALHQGTISISDGDKGGAHILVTLSTAGRETG